MSSGVVTGIAAGKTPLLSAEYAPIALSIAVISLLLLVSFA